MNTIQSVFSKAESIPESAMRVRLKMLLNPISRPTCLETPPYMGMEEIEGKRGKVGVFCLNIFLGVVSRSIGYQSCLTFYYE